MVTITVRLVRSFEYRNSKNVVLQNVDLNITTAELEDIVQKEIKSREGYKAYVKNDFDTMKIFSKAFGTKTSNLIINLDHDPEWILVDSKTLSEQGIEHETEISYFNTNLYTAFKSNPETKW